MLQHFCVMALYSLSRRVFELKPEQQAVVYRVGSKGGGLGSRWRKQTVLSPPKVELERMLVWLAAEEGEVGQWGLAITALSVGPGVCPRVTLGTTLGRETPVIAAQRVGQVLVHCF